MARQNNLGILNAVYPEVRFLFLFFFPSIAEIKIYSYPPTPMQSQSALTLRVGFWT